MEKSKCCGADAIPASFNVPSLGLVQFTVCDKCGKPQEPADPKPDSAGSDEEIALTPYQRIFDWHNHPERYDFRYEQGMFSMTPNFLAALIAEISQREEIAAREAWDACNSDLDSSCSHEMTFDDYWSKRKGARGR